jgi:hypothetical protein
VADGRVINVVEAVAAISFVGMKEQKAKEGRKKERRKGPVPLLSSTIYTLPFFHVCVVVVVVVENVAALDLNGKRKEERGETSPKSPRGENNKSNSNEKVTSFNTFFGCDYFLVNGLMHC